MAMRFTPKLGLLDEYPEEDDAIDDLTDTFSSLVTDEISLVSHNHGRDRRLQRGITRRELQEAVKYGRKEATLGPQGQPRWKYTYNGTTYVTDETSRHEITSWKSEDNRAAFGPTDYGGLVGCSVHVVLVVDHSGSMRKNDVPGYGDRTEAVYETLRRELLMPHIDLMKTALGAACADMAVSLVVMSSESCTLLDRVPIDDALCSKFKELAASAGHHHGHYVPALKRLRKLLKDDAKRKVHPVVFFVSDGAPSDHIDAACKHGVNVWHPDPTARGVHRSGRPILQSCVSPQPCRQEVKKQTVTECCDIVRELGAMFDEDRITMNTIAFGDPNAQYEVLEQMARVLKRGSFQKLGLGIKRLRSALSTLSSTITTMLTSGGGSGLTLREPRPMETKESFHAPVTHVTDQDGWDVYTLHDRKFTLVSKQKYDCKTHTLVDAPLCDAVGVAFSNRPFAQGAERSASRCLEVVPDGRRFAAAGFPLVGKETLFREELKDARFHKRVARCHSEGNELAQRFNARIEKAFPGRAEFKLRYSECWIYTVRDPAYAGGTAWILAEPRLEGKWAKWNNNAGKIGTENASGPVGLCWHVPQAFSHFTYSMTDGKELFCDSQGIWNPTDGFCLTDPARHVLEDHRRHTRDRTDKGMAGMRAFFATHECSELCVQLGLQPFTDVAPLKL